MTAPRALLVDYGMGNLRSLARALERAGAEVSVSADPADIAAADRVVVPGQGAFGQAMARLESTGQADALRAAIAAGRPMLGVCLGLQVLFEASEEAPGVPGLGVFEGQVTLLPVGPGLKRPHMGWSPVLHAGDHPVLAANPSGEAFYFVHSYAAHGAPGVPHATAHHGPVLGSRAGGAVPPLSAGLRPAAHSVCEFVAAVARGPLVATQYHPEKSQEAGHRLLTAWLGL